MSMSNHINLRICASSLLLVLAGCAAPEPLPLKPEPRVLYCTEGQRDAVWRATCHDSQWDTEELLEWLNKPEEREV